MDALGLIIAVVVTTASVADNVIGVRLLDKVVEASSGQPHPTADRNQYPKSVGAGGPNTTTILDLITAREAAATAAREHLREQMTKLARELSDMATTRHR